MVAELTGGGQYNYGFRCSQDGGGNWGNVIYILPSNSYELHSHTFSISNSQIFLIYNRTSNQEKAIEFTKSTDLGQTWTEPVEIFRAERTGLFDMVARGDSVHFVWTGRFNFGDKLDIYYMKSEDAGDGWTDNLMISADDNWHSQLPSISINEWGDLVICWMDYKDSPNFYAGDLFARYSFDAGDSWSSEQQMTFTHEALSPRIVWQGDSVHVCWEDYRYGIDPYYMLSMDNGLTWGEEQRVDDDPSFSEFPDITVSGEDRYIVWSDRRADPGHGVYFSRWEEESAVEEENDILPSEISLTAYPNPFNGATIITFNDLEGGEIEIYSITGQKIRTLITTTKEGKIMWDARDALGNKISSGIYFARARAPQSSTTLKLLYLK